MSLRVNTAVMFLESMEVQSASVIQDLIKVISHKCFLAGFANFLIGKQRKHGQYETVLWLQKGGSCSE